MESQPEPDYENVVFIDEYPEIQKRVWLRRLAAQRMGGAVIHQFQTPTVTELRRPHPDDQPPAS